MPGPLVTVVIPVRNGVDFVADAIESVLAQADVEPEVLVIDDGSTDGTSRILKSFGARVRTFRQANRGLPSARNAGILLSRSELLVFLDADDLHPEHYLRRFLDAAAASPAVDVFHCGWSGIDFAGHPLYAQETPLPLDTDPFHELVLHGSPHIDALCLRRSALPRVGLFEPRLRLQEDWDFWLRLAAAGLAFRGVAGNQAIVRRRAESMSRSAGGELALTGLAVLELHLARHGRCPACPRADEGVRRWQRLAVRSAARDTAQRIGLRGGLGRWAGTILVAARRPRLLPSALAELAAGFRGA